MKDSEKTKEKLCGVCNKPFTPKNNKGTYCSSKCRQSAFFERRHDLLDLLLQIRKEFKRSSKDYLNKIDLDHQIDVLTNDWYVQIENLLKTGKREASIVANDLEGENENHCERS